MKFQLTTNGDLLIYNLHNQNNNNNLNNYYSMESLMTYQEQRIQECIKRVQKSSEQRQESLYGTSILWTLPFRTRSS